MRFLFSCFVFTLFPSLVFAASPTSFVSGATVKAGETAIEARIGYSLDDNGSSNDDRLQIREHIDHGFNDLYALRIIAAQDDRKGDDLTHDNFTIENRFHVIKKADYGWDGGFRLSYTKRNGDNAPDNIGLNFIAQFSYENGWKSRHNAILKRDIFEDADNGISAELRHQVTKSIAPPAGMAAIEIGLELFNDFGDLSDQSGYSAQDHQFGPVIKGKFGPDLSFETGYRTGLSKDARDHVFKFGLSKGF